MKKNITKQPLNSQLWSVFYGRDAAAQYTGGLPLALCDAVIDNWMHAEGATKGNIELVCEGDDENLVTIIESVNDGSPMTLTSAQVAGGDGGAQEILDLPIGDIRRALSHCPTPQELHAEGNPSYFNCGLKAVLAGYCEGITIIGHDKDKICFAQTDRSSKFYETEWEIVDKEKDEERFLALRASFPYDTGTMMRFKLLPEHRQTKDKKDKDKDFHRVMKKIIELVYAKGLLGCDYPLDIYLDSALVTRHSVTEYLDPPSAADVGVWRGVYKGEPLAVVTGQKKSRGRKGNIFCSRFDAGIWPMSTRMLASQGVQFGLSQFKGDWQFHQKVLAIVDMQKSTALREGLFNAQKEVNKSYNPADTAFRDFLMDHPDGPQLREKFKKMSTAPRPIDDETKADEKLLNWLNKLWKKSGETFTRASSSRDPNRTGAKPTGKGSRRRPLDVEFCNFKEKGVTPIGAYWTYERENNGFTIIKLDSSHPFVIANLNPENGHWKDWAWLETLAQVKHYHSLDTDKEKKEYSDALIIVGRTPCNYFD